MNTNTTTNITDAPYGLTLKGVPKKAPGRKPSPITTRTFYVVDGKPLGKGKPTLDVYRNRLKVTISKMDEFNPIIHKGVRDPNDDLKVLDLESKLTAKAAKIPAAGPSIAENSTSVEDSVNSDNSTVLV